jgi:hypothetical protein
MGSPNARRRDPMSTNKSFERRRRRTRDRRAQLVFDLNNAVVLAVVCASPFYALIKPWVLLGVEGPSPTPSPGCSPWCCWA